MGAGSGNPVVLRRWLRTVFVVLGVILVLLVAGGLVVARDLNQSATNRFVRQLIPQRAASRDILLQLVDEETAVRGFVITGRESSLEPYAPARSLAAQDLATLTGFAAGDAQLRPLVQRATSERAALDRYFAGEIALVRSGRGGRQRAAAGIEAGKSLFDGFRQTAAALLALAGVRTTGAEAAQNRYYTSLVGLIAAAGGIALLIVVALGWLVPRRTYRLLVTQQRDAAAANRARALAETIQSLTSELAAAEGVDEVHAALASSGRALLEARALSIGILAADRSAILVWGSGEGARDTTRTLAAADDGPEAGVLRDRTERYFGTAAEAEAAGALVEGPHAAGAVLPLGAAPEAANGYLAVRYSEPQGFEEPQRAVLRTVATLVDQALARAESHDRDKHTARVLQRALLPAALPTPAGAEIRGHYEAAGIGIDVGGDWYEAIELPDGRIAASVGDVAGKGILAAALMGRLRHSYRAYALEGHSPAALLARLTRHIRQDDMATVLAFDLDLQARTLRYSAAGHPPAILLDADANRTTLLDEIGAPPLGIATPEQFLDTSVSLPERGLLVAYTDGLVERRKENVADRIELLGRLIRETRDDDLDALIARVTDAMRGDQLQPDDLAILAVALTPLPSPT